MDLDIILQSEINQRKINTYEITYMCNLKIQQTSEQKGSRLTDLENKLVVTSGESGRGNKRG